ncbi:hypothetical protein [Sphingopyxis sp. JAI108]|uniref:hypothetical protein n=1 Tax=Sphingopyxis sp. JAI108 TaxID=2723060 RepID=UPI0017FF564D|nr:hypothetical protein [Sphingopyxis sp. JAI108]NYF33377.1 hypothetical protein [Sphingopyxis sp. JAI108]
MVRKLSPMGGDRESTASRMHGPHILARSLSHSTVTDKHGNRWQYHSRSDHHSKVACWGVVFDLLRATPLLRRHIEDGTVFFGINHEMRDFVHDRKKNLDLVLCTRDGSPGSRTLADFADDWELDLSPAERRLLAELPALREAPVGSVLLALEAKACMTAHQRALPRLYDELNSSQRTIHGASESAIAVGFTMVNMATDYLSPDLNKKNRATDPDWSRHNQPRDAELAIAKIRQLPRRSRVEDDGYDALSITLVDFVNDGRPVVLHEAAPAPPPGDIHAYASMIARVSGLYGTRFKDIG